MVVDPEVDQVNIPGFDGDMGILANHAPLLTILRPGRFSYQKGEGEIELVVSTGYAEVTDNRVTVLASPLNSCTRSTTTAPKPRAPLPKNSSKKQASKKKPSKKPKTNCSVPWPASKPKIGLIRFNPSDSSSNIARCRIV